MSLNGHWIPLPVVHLTQYNLAKDIDTHWYGTWHSLVDLNALDHQLTNYSTQVIYKRTYQVGCTIKWYGYAPTNTNIIKRVMSSSGYSIGWAQWRQLCCCFRSLRQWHLWRLRTQRWSTTDSRWMECSAVVTTTTTGTAVTAQGINRFTCCRWCNDFWSAVIAFIVWRYIQW